MPTVSKNRIREKVMANGSKPNGKAAKGPITLQRTQVSELISMIRTVTGNPFLSRQAMAKYVSGGVGQDVDTEAGYPEFVTFEMYKKMYEREGIAARVVNYLPSESWAVDPWVYETEKMDSDAVTEAEKRWEEVNKKLGLCGLLHRLDEISGIGQYGVALMGLENSGDWKQRVPGISEEDEAIPEEREERELLYFTPLDQGQAMIATWNNDRKSRRYGKPQTYNIKLTNPANLQNGVLEGMDQEVHWSRVIHVADCVKSGGDTIGNSRMSDVFNYLLNIRKILGGSAEMFWKGGFPGISFEVDPTNVGEIELDKSALSKEISDYMDKLKRYISLNGVHANVMNPNIASPKEHISVQLQAICIAKEYPMRIFTGSEEARMASINDSESNNKRVNRRRNLHVVPKILYPVTRRLSMAGVIPDIKEYKIKWPDLYSISQTDKAEITGKLVRALSEYMTTGVSKIVPPLQFFTMIMDFSTDEAEEIIKAAEEAADNPPNFIPDPVEEEIEKAKAMSKIIPAGGAAGGFPPKGGDKEERKGMGVRPTRKGIKNKPTDNEAGLTRCMVDGKKGVKIEDGTCFTWESGDKLGRKKAVKRAKLERSAKSIARRIAAMEEGESKQ